MPSRNVNGVTGSSPHTRGARCVDDVLLERPGIIPAYAGSTGCATSARRRRRDHPRIRGEHLKTADGPDVAHGSSPHTRGARVGDAATLGGHGIIPAYAGSTFAACVSISPVRDHPRIRGEHARRSAWSPTRPGSSPHTRGAPSTAPVTSVSQRIIPAYAGSTTRKTLTRADPADHPRIRGEHEMMLHKNGLVVGSSPHTRGAPTFSAMLSPPLGIIPAYAGSTLPGL